MARFKLIVAAAWSLAFSVWRFVIWLITPVAALLIWLLNLLLFPQIRTHRPHPIALILWALISIGIFAVCCWHPSAGFGAVLAGLNFAVIASALLVISEDNDIWSGYVLRDDRRIKGGEIVKSLGLILISSVSFLAFLAVAIKGAHAETAIFKERYSAGTSILAYVATVLAQIPAFESGLKSAGIKGIMEFQGVVGTIIKYSINLSYVSIILGAINSYFRQKSQLRRLVDAIASRQGDRKALEAQAARAPEEIKRSIINMALRDPHARVREAAMRIAVNAGSIRFPNTIIYNLHKEPSRRNKRRALALCGEFMKIRRAELQPVFYKELQETIDGQLNRRRKHHDRATLRMLEELLERTRTFA